MKLVTSLCLSLVVALICSVSIAQESAPEGKTCSKCPSSTSVVSTDEKSCSECPASAVATDEKTCSECPVSVAMKNLPTMTYKVGDKEICCSESAAALAKKAEKPVHFVVAKKTYETKEAAYTALVESTESFVNNFVTPAKCETSGKTSIAGKSCGCPMEAGKNAAMVKKAIGDIKMTYVVGETKCNCPTQAKALAKEGDAKTTYVVAGKETCCNLEARMNLAKAKYAAAVKAMMPAPAKTETKSSGSDS